MEAFFATIVGIWEASGFNAFFIGDGWKYAVMIAVSCGLLYLAIDKHQHREGLQGAYQMLWVKEVRVQTV